MANTIITVQKNSTLIDFNNFCIRHFPEEYLKRHAKSSVQRRVYTHL